MVKNQFINEKESDIHMVDSGHSVRKRKSDQSGFEGGPLVKFVRTEIDLVIPENQLRQGRLVDDADADFVPDDSTNGPTGQSISMDKPTTIIDVLLRYNYLMEFVS